MKNLLIGISAGVLALASAGYAAETRPGDHMGAIETRAEAKAKAEEAFAKLDLNHDGKLDAADRAARIGLMFDKIDANHDGTISRDEFIAAHEKMHHGMGRPWSMGGEHPDGEHHEGDHHEGMGPGHMGGRMGDHHRREKMGVLMAIFHEADPNHTGSITKDAFVEGALKLFDKVDTNHDGKVTPEERHAARAAMREHIREHRQKDGIGHGPKGDMPPPPPVQ